MAETSLKVEKREIIDKKETKKIRKNGGVPGIYYFHGQDSIPLSADEKELKRIIQSDVNIIDLSFSDKKKAKCVIRDIQWDVITGNPIHIDFLGIKMTEKVTLNIPIYITGTSTGVKNAGGILQNLLREISIECLPADIPERFEVDVTSLDIGGSIQVGNLKIDNVTILTDPEQSVVSVTHPTIIKEPTPEEEITEPEVIGAKKEETEEKE